jgi:hypothetical protein
MAVDDQSSAPVTPRVDPFFTYIHGHISLHRALKNLRSGGFVTIQFRYQNGNRCCQAATGLRFNDIFQLARRSIYLEGSLGVYDYDTYQA